MADDEVDELVRELEGLRIRREELLTRLTEARRRRGARGFFVVGPAPLVVGERVRITNRVRRPAGWPPAPNDETDQVGVVTRVTATRIYVTTDTGINTWRAKTNVTRVA
jgi:hypothetical protein